MTNRDEKGKFVKGNKASAGRPKGERAYIKAMLNAVSLDEWQQATSAMLRAAIAGDVQAFKAIAPYLVGLPAQKLSLSAGDAILLSEVLDAFKQKNISAGDVFNSMLALVAEQDIANE